MKQKRLTAASSRTLLAVASAAAVAAALSLPASAQALMNNLQAVKAGVPFDGFIVKFRQGTPERATARSVSTALSGVAAQMRAGGLMPAPDNARGIGAFGLQHARRMGLGADVVRSSTRLTPAQALEVMQRLAQLPGVEYVEPNLIVQPAMSPNDPAYQQQWNLTSATAGIRAPAAWDQANGAGITIAILDSGITGHSDLQANLVPGYDFISSAESARDGNGRDPNPSDQGDWDCRGAVSTWHGTHVAGIAAAVTNNATGVAGVAYGAKIMPVRVTGCGGEIGDLADAINWASGGDEANVPTLAASAQAKVINLSLGIAGNCSFALQEAIDKAVSRGSTLVAAAGNTRDDVSGYLPANCKNVIAIANIQSDGGRYVSSNYGAMIDLAAPGANVTSTSNSGMTKPGAENYLAKSGTSQSAPHVSGTVALMQSRRMALGKPLLSPRDIEVLLKGTSYRFPGDCGQCGAGILDANAAVMAAAIAPDTVPATGSVKLSEHSDASGRIKVALFARSAPVAQAHFTDFAIDVPDDYVVVGGGAEGQDVPQGNLLTASYPNANLSAWLVSSKDHLASAPVKVRGWAIGVKIAGLSRQQVRDAITVSHAVSALVSHGSVAATLPAGYLLLGGGFRVDWSGTGNLGVSSYPNTAASWHVQSKDHVASSPAYARAYVIGIRDQIAGVGNLRNAIGHTLSAYAAHPAARTTLQSGFALTGCGADGRYNGTVQGNLLWRIQPADDGVQRSCLANSKDHVSSSPGHIDAYAIGLQAY